MNDKVTGKDSPDLQTISLPVTPVIPPNVVSGQTIMAAHENQVVKALSDLWTDVQAVGVGAVPAARKITVTAPLTGGGDLAADRVIGIDTSGLVPTSRRIIAGTGLTGGGDLTADRTLAVNSAAIAGGIQTPWLQNIDGAAHTLTNVNTLTVNGLITCLNVTVNNISNAGLYQVSGAAFASASAGKIAVTCDSISTTGPAGIGGSLSVTGNIYTGASGSVNVGTGVNMPGVPLWVLGNLNGEVARFQPRNDASNIRSFISLVSTNAGFWWELSIQDAVKGGTQNSLVFLEHSNVASIERVCFAAGGNVGIGTQSANASLEIKPTVGMSTIKAGSLELQNHALNNSYLNDNVFYNGTNYVFRLAGYSSMLRMLNGAFEFHTSNGSGSAGGAMGLNYAMMVANNGNVTVSGVLAVGGAANSGQQIQLFDQISGYPWVVFSVGDILTIRNRAGATVLTLNSTAGLLTPYSLGCTALPSASPGAGSKQFWYDPADGNRVKYAP